MLFNELLFLSFYMFFYASVNIISIHNTCFDKATPCFYPFIFFGLRRKKKSHC